MMSGIISSDRMLWKLLCCSSDYDITSSISVDRYDTIPGIVCSRPADKL